MSTRFALMTLSVLLCSVGFADWTRTSGPEGGMVRAIAIGQNAMLGAIHPGQIYRSNGGVWTPVANFPATRIISVGNSFLAITQQGVARSVDNGSTWVDVLPSSNFPASAITVDRGVVYASISDTIYKSLDEGETWAFAGHAVNLTGCLLAAGDTILIGSSVGFGLQRSTDGGTTFNPVNGPSGSGIVNSLERLGEEFFASFGQSGVFRSTDGGLSWELRSSGLPRFDISYYAATRMLAAGATLYAVANMRVFRYDGETWSSLPLDVMVHDIDGTASTLLGGTAAGVWQSSDNGATWTEENDELIATTPRMFGRIGDQIFTPVSNRIARTTDNGTTWSFPANLEANRLVAHGTSLFAATLDGISRSTDNGVTWTLANQGITQYLPDIRDLAVTNDAVYASFYHIMSFHGNSSWFSGGVFRSTNNGESWIAINNGLPRNATSVVAPTHRVAANGQLLFAATVAGVFRSTNAGANWSPAGNGIPENTWVENLYTSPSYTLLGSGRGIFRFNGSVWEEMNSGLPQANGFYPYAHSFVEYEGLLYAATSDGVFRFEGASWSRFGTNEPATSPVLGIVEINGELLAAVSTKGVWKHSLSPLAVDGGTAIPRRFYLAENYPNPFNPGTNLWFQIADYGLVSLRVFDLIGREVATLVNEEKAPGSYSVQWNALDAASGVYLARLESAGNIQVRRMLLLK
ncbi:MAG: T9SS type A sorting domain-containing protein [Bacteroidetes bacterium]|nr:T9SS type A sorting domain-containing protein [Bacteroidota bacterium]MCW5894525.1 T9SS type A sorting domain-containing protein [Bacteroidota bacterium]